MFSEFIYNLIIGPLELFFEVLYVITNRLLNNPGLSIIVLSITMNFLVLPLYKRADAIQEEERQINMKLSPWVKHIKSAFKGNERFMILQTYYRQNNYKTTDTLKGYISLLLEIPFFIAAYNFLSNLQVLNGVQFGFINDLGAPDAMFVVNGFNINILPILMTLINFISASIYMKGFPLKNKIQMYGMAIIFLIILYNSPAGLVLYWTLNNLFSLIKNIFYKLENPKKILRIIGMLCGALMIFIGVMYPQPTVKREIFIIGLGIILQIPLLYSFFIKNVHVNRILKSRKTSKEVVNEKEYDKLFFINMIFLSIMVGLYIPSGVMKASPAEFIDVLHFINPSIYVLNSLALAIGTFVLWFGVFYQLSTKRIKKVFAFTGWCMTVIAIIDFMFFGRFLGTLSSALTYIYVMNYTVAQQLFNTVVIIETILICHLLYSWKKKFIKNIVLVGVIAIMVMSIINIGDVTSYSIKLKKQLEKNENGMVTIPLSKNGKNVIVLMLDRAIGQYVPYIMKEKPELQEIFSGFTYYSNAISYGGLTNVGTPVLYGGYDYTPEKMNERDQDSLCDKQNEALKVLPVLFDNNDYEVTVCDPPYAGYEWIPDLSIYDEYPEINAYNTIGKLNEYDSYKNMKKIYDRNFFCYSIFKIAPVVLQETIYNKGNYNKSDIGLSSNRSDIASSIGVQYIYNISEASDINETFMDNYYVLNNLSNITEVSNESKNTFLIMSNCITHEPMMVDESTYEPAINVDNTEYDKTHTDRFLVNGRTLHIKEKNAMIHYQTNVVALLKMAEWINYLKEQGVYDNTRIIIVSDHGRDLHSFEDMELNCGDNSVDVSLFNSFMMVKDFGDTEYKTSDEFMTLGDVANLATQGVIDKPINPFTGTDLSDVSEKEGKQMILLTDWHIDINCGTKFVGGSWYSIHDNIYDINNWAYEGPNP